MKRRNVVSTDRCRSLKRTRLEGVLCGGAGRERPLFPWPHNKMYTASALIRLLRRYRVVFEMLLHSRQNSNRGGVLNDRQMNYVYRVVTYWLSAYENAIEGSFDADGPNHWLYKLLCFLGYLRITNANEFAVSVNCRGVGRTFILLAGRTYYIRARYICMDTDIILAAGDSFRSAPLNRAQMTLDTRENNESFDVDLTFGNNIPNLRFTVEWWGPFEKVIAAEAEQGTAYWLDIAPRNRVLQPRTDPDEAPVLERMEILLPFLRHLEQAKHNELEHREHISSAHVRRISEGIDR